jgi:hypothetical protein
VPKTKDDHQKLADYYRVEMERFQEEAKDHDEMAEMYKNNPDPMAIKHPEAIRRRPLQRNCSPLPRDRC